MRIFLEIAQEMLLQGGHCLALQPGQAGLQRVPLRGQAPIRDVDAVLCLGRLPGVLGQGENEFLQIAHLDLATAFHGTAFEVFAGVNRSLCGR